MALSKKTLKRRNYASKAAYVLLMSASLRMDQAAEEYNSTFQRSMSAKHHPDPAYRALVLGHRSALWNKYAKARTAFFSARRKYGIEFTKRVLGGVNTKPARHAVTPEALKPKPGMFRKKATGVINAFSGAAVLPETVDALTVGEMTFEQAAVLFKQQLVRTLVDKQGVDFNDALNMVEDYNNHRNMLLGLLNTMIEKEELKVYFTRHRTLPSNTPFNVTKITDV